MKVLNMLSAVSCCAVGLTSMSSAHAQQQNQDFQLAFCNISAYTNVLVSVAHRQDGQSWRVDGWYPIPDFGCALIGSFQRDTVYYYANGRTSDGRVVAWSAADTDQTATSQCIDRDKFFQATAGVPSCPSGQELAKFKMIKVAPDRSRITWTLTGD
jgi:uncharacterized membrane protein